MGIRAKLLLFVSWFPASLLTLVLCLNLLSAHQQAKDHEALLRLQAREMLSNNEFQYYMALPQVLGGFSTSVATADARPEILRQFLEGHDSPIAPYADTIVAESDKYHVDFRLITAIGMCESNVGKKMPEGSHNAFGYAIYTGQNSGAEFESWEHSISVMAKYLAERFYAHGLTTPEQIGPIYAPPSVNTGNSWARCVRTFMDELI
ncbi:hypothetical protein C4579_00570 [Candidatus Microgenomates bacterium]|nr:MAG: hypothetical protein C4579_00570 [Candidatus Microgenomates bacterium]